MGLNGGFVENIARMEQADDEQKEPKHRSTEVDISLFFFLFFFQTSAANVVFSPVCSGTTEEHILS